jgi:hypothetical protein
MIPVLERMILTRLVKGCLACLIDKLRETREFALVLIIVILVGFTGCSSSEAVDSNSKTPAASTQPSAQNNLGLLQQNKGCAVRLYGLMTFNAFNQDFSYPTEFKMPPIAITWMGHIFNGRVQTTGPGAAIYEIHGGASEDGNWIETMYYSVNTVQPNSQFGILYRITLRNVPLKTASSGTSLTPFFEMSGSDVQKYVSKIEYSGSNKYVSTDWQTQNQGQLPALKVEFIKDEPVQSGTAGGGGM